MTRGSGRKASIASRLSSRRPIQVVGTHRLGAKASISVVEIDGRRMVLGVTEHGITVLVGPATPEAPVSAAPPTFLTPRMRRPSSPATLSPSAGDALASPAEPRPVTPDVAFALRLALEEVAEPVAPVAAAHVAPARRRPARRHPEPRRTVAAPVARRRGGDRHRAAPDRRRASRGSRAIRRARAHRAAALHRGPTDSLSLPSASEHPPARAAAAPAVAVPPRATPARVDRATAGADPGFAAMLAAASRPAAVAPSRPTAVAPARASAFGPAASLDSLDDEPARPLVAPIPASVASRSFSGAVPLASRLPVLHRAS